jgi:hypothetical protein
MSKPAAYDPRPGKGLLDLMKAAKVPATPTNFMNLSHLGNPPKTISPEERDEIPEHLRPYIKGAH